MQKNRHLKILVVIVGLTSVYWYGFRTDPGVEALNQVIKEIGSPALRNYPYTFRVERLADGMAVMGTPRSPEMPVSRMLGAIYPNLSGKAPNNPDFVAAEKELAQIQSEARQIVLSQPGVISVKWELDQRWLLEHNISLN